MNIKPSKSIYSATGLCAILLLSFSLPGETDHQKRAWTILDTGRQDKSADKRAEAVTALGLLTGNRKAVELVENALADPVPEVRRAAVITLGDLNSKASVPKLRNILNQSDASVVVAIASVLLKYKDPLGYEIYYEILTGERKVGGGILSGLKNKKNLEKMGLQEAVGFVPFGGVGLGAYNYFKDSGNSAVDVAAAAALAVDPDPASKKALVQACFGRKDVISVAALRALAQRGDSSVVNDIQAAMYSGSSSVSYTAAAAVLHLSSLHAAPRH